MSSIKLTGAQVGGNGRNIKNIDKYFTIKKLFTSAIFDPEYSEFFINNIYDKLCQTFKCTLEVFSFNDANKEITITVNNPNGSYYNDINSIRMAFEKTIVDIINNGRMHDILYLRDNDAYNVLKSSYTYGHANKPAIESELFSSFDIASMFNINVFGNGTYILSLIQ